MIILIILLIIRIQNDIYILQLGFVAFLKYILLNQYLLQLSSYFCSININHHLTQ
jgi:hypothetical protein